MNEENLDTVELATALTVAWLSNSHNRVNAEDVPAFIAKMHETVAGLSSGAPAEEAAPAAEYSPAVTARKSLASKDHIISMIDGKPYKTLRRHLSTNGMTPEQYRERYNLKADYPMVAESYSEARRAMAKTIGLGRKKGETNAARADAAAKPKAAAKGRKSASDAAKAHLGSE